MIIVKGKLITTEEKENKGYKYTNLYIDSGNVLFPHIVKVRKGEDYQKYIDKNSMTELPLYLDCWDDRAKKFSPKGVNLNLKSAKA